MDNSNYNQNEIEKRQVAEDRQQSDSQKRGWLPPLDTVNNPSTAYDSENPATEYADRVEQPQIRNAGAPSFVPPAVNQNAGHSHSCYPNPYSNPVCRPYVPQPYNPQTNYGYPPQFNLPYTSPYPNHSRFYTQNYVSPVTAYSPIAQPASNGYPCYPPMPASNWETVDRENKDTMHPLSVLGSRFITEEEFGKLQRKKGGVFSAKTVGLAGILFLLLLAVNFIVAAKNRNIPVVSICLLIAVTLYLLGGIIFLVKRRDYIRNQFNLKKELSSGESVIELYSDKIAEISKSKRVIIPYANVKVLIEMPELIAVIGNQDQTIILKAKDIIPFDAQRVKEILYPRLQRVKKRFYGGLIAQLQEPLPIPVINQKSNILLSIPIETETDSINAYSEDPKKRIILLLLLFSFGIVLGTQTANLFWLTRSFVLDILIFTVIIFLVLVLISVIADHVLESSRMRRYKKDGQPSGIAFTEYGTAICTAGATCVIPWKKLKVTENGEGLLLNVFCDEITVRYFLVKWKYISEKEKLLEIMKEHGCKIEQ